MAITDNDLKLMRAERNTDNADGGGMMTGAALSDTNINNLWDDVDSTELARGGVSIRRFFPAVRSRNTDKLLGARCAIVQDADADNVSTLLFQSDDHYAERAQIQADIESYVVIGTQSPLRPVGTQREGQNALVLYADKATDAPGVGDVLVLEDTNTQTQQFIKITDVDTTLETYSYQSNDKYLEYQAHQFLLSISQPLNHTFEGSDPQPAAPHTTHIWKTQANNSARYYGISSLAQAAAAGEKRISVTDIQAPLVPTVTSDVSMTDQTPGVATQVIQPSSGRRLTRALGSHNHSVTLTLPTGWVPGSLSLDIAGAIYADRGESLHLISGSNKISNAIVKPGQGALILTLTSHSAITATYTPGVSVTLTPYTLGMEITASNRQLTYTDLLQPIPARASLRIEYQYLGEWYSITEDGTGTLSGAGGATGSVNFETGSISYVLAGEPDAGTMLIYTWGAISGNTKIVGAPTAGLVFDLPVNHVLGSAVFSWSRNNNSYSLIEQPDGSWSGDGHANVISGAVLLQPSQLPDGSVTLSYTGIATEANEILASLSETSSGTITFNTVAGVLPHHVHFSLSGRWSLGIQVNGTESARTVGALVVFEGQPGGTITARRLIRRGLESDLSYELGVVGSIDQTTGVVTVDVSALKVDYERWIKVGGYWQSAPAIYQITLDTQSPVIEYRTTEPVDGVQSIETAWTDLIVRFNTRAEGLLPGSLQFILGGMEVVDRGDGNLYRNWTLTTAAGSKVGQINYSDATMELAFHQLSPYINDLNTSWLSAAIGFTEAVVDTVVFRTASNPLRPSGVQLMARRFTDTSLITAESDASGTIAGTFDSANQQTDVINAQTGATTEVIPADPVPGAATGNVDYQSGVVVINFDQPVTIDSLTYNAVAYSSIPLNPDLLGLDPVKLPSNGKVPVFKPGYLVLIHHTDTITEASPTAGQIIDCGRTQLAVVRITDAAGTSLASTQYVTDLEAGTVTLADPFSAIDADGNSLTMPLTISHRVQDLCAVAGVRIDGHIQLMTQLTHNYPEGSLCSAVIEFGDLQARIENLFEQKIDVGGVFRDTLEGDTSVAQYDALTYPMEVDNQSAVQERWKLLFRSNSTYSVIGEQRGILVESQAKGSDCSPINPFTGQPYFTIRAAGFGSGWVTGNVVRFNTVAAAAPVEAIRTTLPSHQRLPDQSVMIEFMGDAD